jgi:hypothetical protein
MKILLALVLVALPGCATQRASERVAVVWNRVEDPHRVCESLSGRKNFFNILGCSQWSDPVSSGAPRVCSIYAPAPRSAHDTQRFATLGHELMHCFDGNWHDRWGRMNPDTQSAAAGGTAPTPK